ncbi:MAG: hypothetical protein V2I43_24450 [Parvularcula sp.]|jgi:hypothetical protein|nr:hypothetical protein [Parvularcula sp.]
MVSPEELRFDHVVPTFLLKNWAIGNDTEDVRRWRVSLLDVNRLQSVKSSTVGQVFGGKGYDGYNDELKGDWKYINLIETSASRLLKGFLERGEVGAIAKKQPQNSMISSPCN